MVQAKMKARLKERAIFLDSGGGWFEKGASALALEDPCMSLSFRDGVSVLRTGGSEHFSRRGPLDLLEEMLAQGFFAVGYLSYEFFQFLLPDLNPSPQKNGQAFPHAAFLFFEEDQTTRQRSCERWDPPQSKAKFQISGAPCSNMNKTDFVHMVERAREYIAKGDVYQINLSQRFEIPFRCQPEAFLAKLYRVQPVPFACCLNFGEFQLLSGSMELFLRKKGRRLVTGPIKGTRKRGMSEDEDERLRRELLESEKERAENLMIVDLMRNDLSRVCEFGSVRVNKLFEIRRYSTLFQMVSEVGGRLRDGITLKDILSSTFPPGSVTGAPKIRAMEIIDELEPHYRGPYCGAIGFFKPDGDFTLSVAIRIFTAFRGIGTFWMGGGITWSSVAEREYEETLVKARATLEALRWGE
jgi:aminodeoxychorismate synthase component I